MIFLNIFYILFKRKIPEYKSIIKEAASVLLNAKIVGLRVSNSVYETYKLSIFNEIFILFYSNFNIFVVDKNHAINKEVKSIQGGGIGMIFMK